MSTTVSIAEGKKGFSRLIREASEKKERVLVTKRKKPVAVIVPYEEYQRSLKLDGYQKIMEAREIFTRAKAKAKDIYRESRKMAS